MEEIGAKEQGWSWEELDNIDESIPYLRAHRDALKLLADMVQHGDNKSSQQRLVCLSPSVGQHGGASCRPFMCIADLGATFGGAGRYTIPRSARTGGCSSPVCSTD